MEGEFAGKVASSLGQKDGEKKEPSSINEDLIGLPIVSRTLSDTEFHRLSLFVKEKTGITLPEAKKMMLQARLQKRLRALSLKNFSEYCRYLFSPHGVEHEVGEFINVVTTNKTDFFRESHHFDFLVNSAIPFLNEYGLLQHHNLNVWSAACSSGMEPYTIAMMLSEYRASYHELSWRILGTDVSTYVLQKASRAIYDEEAVDSVPMEFRKKYLLRSTDRSRHLVKITPELRSSVEFKQLNFMQDDYQLRQRFEVIFCRNAIIYFDRPTVFEILKKITKYLIPGGFLFLGHSESLNGFPLPFDVAGPTIYQRKLTD